MVWSTICTILLLSVIASEGDLIYDGGWSGDAGATDFEAPVDRIAAFAQPPETPSDEDFVDRVNRMTVSSVDGAPRFFPVGLDATLAYGVGDCTDLALLRTEILRRNGIAARPVHGIMIWDTKTFRTNALHVTIFGKGIAVHDWVELEDGRTMGAYEGVPGIRCIKTGNGVCLQPVFKVMGYL
ncbi:MULTISPECIES: transglutaminase-like domain-containing protein [Methanoculleus]|uniref:Transglutaminase-like superfamily protein n=1 Tax=Methanoculleus thermophilus TaxID=2200 RepID=A0A1G9BYG5_9EURY|nr:MULTISPECIES: transglutaminase-like domain-containing protein [Methanoculleus]NLN08110.1 transglutaminase domain-containing protein [Methanoculleus thermophilus]SDK44433.1 Transglutaminase-like superfamily protein [Methanoculleus thermophilus]HQD26326.1 transglutaminase-like domain-containing protein [Methanoculleus thermophilus]